MKLDHVGWQVGITYGCNRPGGLDHGYMSSLLDEMEDNGMNLLSLMMLSYGYFDPEHDGYCWPVKNPKLKCYKDEQAINGIEDKEFVSKVITEAKSKGIEVELFLNWGIWNPAKIKQEYPMSLVQETRKGSASGWLHCPDSPGAWQLGLDEVEDLLKCYDLPNVTRYAFERVGYGGHDTCYCKFTRELFEDKMGFNILDASSKQRQDWKFERVFNLLKVYVGKIKKVKPGIKVGLHTEGKAAWGHDPNTLKDAGIDYVQPHTIQFKETKKKLFRKLEHLSPNPCNLHFCARDQAPSNYPIWIKTPKIIQKVLGWVKVYPGENLKGLLFFNEPSVSRRNKNAVYAAIQQFT
ncbi:MAG: hypothetical protein ACFFCS_07770 [Candidatus Hodarchaeota archaeon]